MSMLAERKRREKWCLNPRGNAWSDDQSKFGQKILEKMGWSVGQGLGVNNQGPTEIVKVKKKDNNKGLGFKDNGEEWLKTTSEFNELLDQLGNSANNDNTEQVSDTPSSLEDRSKKSKARVHYHKFTRGKDLSRYSEKDLACIIGPEAMKRDGADNTDSHYTSNQINKGNSVDYFNGKKQLNLNQSSEQDNIVQETETFGTEEEKINKKCKKSKKNKESEECDAQENGANISKKRKKISVIESESLNLEANHEIVDGEAVTVDSTVCIDKRSKKKKKHVLNNDIEQLNSENSSSLECDSKKDTKKKSKRSNCDSEIENGEVSKNRKINCEEELIETNEDLIYGNLKKKKRKTQDIENSEQFFSEDVHPENKKKNKKKKSKTNIECVLPQEQFITEEICETNAVDENSLEENVQGEELQQSKNKSKKKKKNIHKEANEEAPSNQIAVDSEQASLSVDSCGYLKVFGRKTRLPKVNSAQKKIKNTKFETNDYMSLDNSNTNENPFAGKNKTCNDNLNNNTNRNPSCTTIYGMPNKDDCSIAKHVISFEYRQLMAKLKKLKVVVPIVKVIIKGAANLSQATHRKLKTLHKSKQLKTLLPPKDLAELEVTVKRFSDSLKPKIDMINALVEMENKTAELAKELTGKSNDLTASSTLQCNAEPSKEQKSEKFEVLMKMSNQLELLLKDTSETNNVNYSPKKRRNKNSSNIDKRVTRSMSTEKNAQAGKKDSSQEDNSALQKRIEERLKVLADQMKILVQGKNPGNIQSERGRGRGRGTNVQSEQGRGRGRGTTRDSKNQTESSRGNINRRRGRGISRGWPSLRGSFDSQGALGFGAGNEMGRGYFTNFVSRGRGGFRGRGRGDLRGRGRIAQNNFDAKRYAEKCKALNKVPELAFKGVDLSSISGYAANLIPNSNVSTPSKPVSAQGSPVKTTGTKQFTQSIKKSIEILEVVSNKKTYF